MLNFGGPIIVWKWLNLEFVNFAQIGCIKSYQRDDTSTLKAAWL